MKADAITVKRIVDQYVSDPNATIRNIAKQNNISEPTLVRWIKKAGYETHPYPRPIPIDEEKIKQALYFYNNIRPNSIAAAKYAGIGKNKFRKYLKDNNLLLKEIKIQKNIEYDKNFFNVLDTEEKAYWFGFIFGDGSIRASASSNQLVIELQENDANHLEKFKQSIRSNKDLKFRQRKNKSGFISKTCSITISCKEIVEDLICKGCVPNKTYDGYPKYDFKTNQLKAAFLRGYIDADGWISKDDKIYSISIVIKNHKTMNFLNRMIINLTNVIPSIRYENDALGSAYRIRITNKKDFFQFLNIIYRDATIYMDRKYENYKLHCRPEPTTAEGSESINGVLSGKAVTP